MSTSSSSSPHRKHRGRKTRSIINYLSQPEIAVVHHHRPHLRRNATWRIPSISNNKSNLCTRKPMLLLCLILTLSSCDGFSDSQYDDMNGGNNGGDHYAWNRMAEDDYCKGIDNSTNIAKFSPGQAWCLPKDYNQEKTPFTFLHLTNRSLPWEYNFTFVVEEISNINDKDQTMSISMYFGVSWLDPRIQINRTASEWTEVKTGPKDEVNVSPQSLRYIWYPELEIYGLERFGRQRVLKEMSGVRIRKNKSIHYELGARITISCRMNFDDYPLDAHTCQFQVGSYYDTNKTVGCVSSYIYDQSRQRSLQHYIKFFNLTSEYKTVILPSGSYAACGFQLQLVRKTMQFLVQVYLPSGMFVVVSWVSFLIKPEVVPGRMALLVTLFLVLINIFNSVRERAPISTRLNAVDLYLVVCIFLVLSALLEYALILLLLKKRRKPKSPWTIEGGLMKMFNNGDASKPLKDRRATNIAVGSAGCTGISAGVGSSAIKNSGSNTSTNPEGPLEENNKMLQEPCDDIEPQQPVSRRKNRPTKLFDGIENTCITTPTTCYDNDTTNDLEIKTLDLKARFEEAELQQALRDFETKRHQIQIYTDPPVEVHIQSVCDNIDAWAMWIAPPIFILFNVAYWISYQHADKLDDMIY